MPSRSQIRFWVTALAIDSIVLCTLIGICSCECAGQECCPEKACCCSEGGAFCCSSDFCDTCASGNNCDCDCPCEHQSQLPAVPAPSEQSKQTPRDSCSGWSPFDFPRPESNFRLQTPDSGPVSIGNLRCAQLGVWLN